MNLASFAALFSSMLLMLTVQSVQAVQNVQSLRSVQVVKLRGPVDKIVKESIQLRLN